MQKVMNTETGIIGILVNKFYQDFVKPEDQKFFDFVFSENPSQQALDELLEVWDIEVKGGNQALLLSYLMKDHPELKFGDYTAPRLRGLINFHRYKNVKTLAHFSRVGRALNKEGILPVLFKGAAMKSLRPDFSRPMADVDFLVRPGEYDRSISIARKCGFEGTPARHSIGMTTADNQGEIDIHEFIKIDDLEGRKASGFAEELNAGFYKRSRKQTCFVVECLMLSHEDLFFITLTNLCKNMTVRTSVQTILFALFDLKFLMSKEDFDWGVVFENIKISDSAENIRVATEFVDLIVPGFLPDTLRKKLPFEGEVRNWYERVFYDQYHYLDFRAECHVLRAAVKKKLSLWPKYALMNIKYVLMRLIRKRPSLVRFYLGRAYAHR
jgi:hypothetical protein